MVPDYCEATVDVRLPIGVEHQEIIDVVNHCLEGTEGIECEYHWNSEGNYTEEEEAIVQAVKKNAEALWGIDVIPAYQWASSDAREYRAKGIPTIQYGPSNTEGIHSYNENVDIELVVPEIKSSLTLDYDDVLYRTLTNSSFALENEISILEAQQEVARAKSEVGLQATLHATFGLNQVDERFKNAYMNLLDQEVLGLTLSMPILDWGLSKGRVKVAKSLNDVVEMEVAQKEQEMREDIMFRVLQFNLQSQQCSVSAQADSIGRQRYENTRERFLNGTATVTDLNTAQTEMDDAITNYLNALGNYWKYYYEIRQLALYDYMNDRMLAEDFDKLVENEY